MVLAYTLENLMIERAVIQRATRVDDGYGAGTAPHWEPHLTVPCRLWWDRSTGERSANRTYVTPARTADVSQGGILVPLGTDVLETDQITEIQSLNPETGGWVNYLSGTLTITAVLTQEDHMELDVIRTTLGG